VKKRGADIRARNGRQARMDYRNAFDTVGSVAVITGGSRDICFESAGALGACGAKTILAGRDQEALAAAVEELTKKGVKRVLGDRRHPLNRQWLHRLVSAPSSRRKGRRD
jgi:NAD(P)-dependent dehydrogenase (short-subunit alcohol dehydrogenase family)